MQIIYTVIGVLMVIRSNADTKSFYDGSCSCCNLRITGRSSIYQSIFKHSDVFNICFWDLNINCIFFFTPVHICILLRLN